MGLWTDEYWYIYPDAVSVWYQVSGRLSDYRDMKVELQQNELLTRPVQDLKIIFPIMP